MTPDDLQRDGPLQQPLKGEAPMSKHTPGPWGWELNLKSKRLCLVSNGLPASMHEIVMDFERWGFGGATPRFRKPVESRPSLVLMHKAHEFAQVVPNRAHHSDWFQRLDHPDARLIAAAPDILEAARRLLDVIAEPIEIVREHGMDNAVQAMADAIAKATGGEA